MERIGVILLAMAALTVLASPLRAAEKNLLFHVSPNGNDSWSGRLPAPNRQRSDGPVRSLERARDLIRAARGAEAVPARILMHGGQYFLEQAVVLEAQDSGLSIETAPGEKPVLYAGRRVTGWQKDGDRFWSAPLPEVASRQWDFRMLLVNGDRARRARTPREGFLEHRTEWKVPWMSTTGGGWQRKPTEAELTTMQYRPGDLGSWLDLANAEVTIYHLWDESVVGLAAHDEATQTLTFSSHAGHPPGGFGVKKYVVWNIREGMHAPGQWYLDRTAGKVVYWPLPGQEMARAEVIAPTAESIFVLRGTKDARVRDVSISGLTLAVTNTPLKAGGFGAGHFGGAIGLSYTQDCRLAGLTIRQTGGQGIKAWESNGLRVEGCEVSYTGACGIRASGEGPIITNNHIHHTGVAYPSAIALSVGGRGCQVTHNEVHDTTYSAITAGGNDHRIERNLIYRAMRELHDGAGIYITFCKNVVLRGNVIRDIVETGGPGSSAYYLDEQAEGCLVEGNLALRCDRFTQNHMAKGNTLRGNVFVADRDVRLTFPKSSDYVLEGNVVVSTGKISVGNTAAIATWKDNLFYSGTGAYEGLPAEVRREDPAFRDPARDDYRFRPGSPATALGIAPIETSKAGRLKAGK